MQQQVSSLTGEPVSLEQFRGDVLLIVNTASECGFTPQYEGLETLYRIYKDRGFTVLGFPSNDFGGQEPGTAEQIGAFCTSHFNVSFPMFEKVVTVGPDKHPLFRALVEEQPEAIDDGPELRQGLETFASEHGLPAPSGPPEILWNFEKFLIARDGSVIARFPSSVKPGDPRISSAIEQALDA